MYKYTDNTQSNFLSFNQPIGLHMNPKNRWVKMADVIPWEIFEKKYDGYVDRIYDTSKKYFMGFLKYWNVNNIFYSF